MLRPSTELKIPLPPPFLTWGSERQSAWWHVNLFAPSRSSQVATNCARKWSYAFLSVIEGISMGMPESTLGPLPQTPLEKQGEKELGSSCPDRQLPLIEWTNPGGCSSGARLRVSTTTLFLSSIKFCWLTQKHLTFYPHCLQFTKRLPFKNLWKNWHCEVEGFCSNLNHCSIVTPF